MATRSSSNTGVLVTVTILGVLLLAAFVVAIIFYGEKQRAQKELAQAQEDAREFLGAQAQQDWAQQWLTIANQTGNQPVIRYMHESYRQAMDRVTGDPEDKPADFQASLEGIEGADASPLVRLHNRR